MKNIKCIICKKDIDTKNKTTKFCSDNCRNIHHGRTGTKIMSTASVGSVSEMMACCELLKKGYSVFRSVSASAFCDIVAVKREETLLIEVRTGYISSIGNINFPHQLHNTNGMPTHYGIYIPVDNSFHLIKITKEDIKKYSIKNRENIYRNVKDKEFYEPI